MPFISPSLSFPRIVTIFSIGQFCILQGILAPGILSSVRITLTSFFRGGPPCFFAVPPNDPKAFAVENSTQISTRLEMGNTN